MRFSLLPRLLTCLILCTLPAITTAQQFAAATDDSELASRIEAVAADLVAGSREELPAGTTIILIAPPAERSPLPLPDVNTMLRQVASAMRTALDGTVSVVAGGDTAQALLEDRYAREGQDGYQAAIRALREIEADYALVASVSVEGDRYAMGLTLLRRADGAVLVEVPDFAIPQPAVLPLPHETAIDRVVVALQEAAPQAIEAPVSIFAFPNERTELVTIGNYLSQRVASSWLTQARQRLATHGAGTIRQMPEREGFHITGTVFFMSDGLLRLNVTLSEGPNTLATEFVNITRAGLPGDLPDANAPIGSSYASVMGLLDSFDAAWLRMEVLGGRSPVYEVCADIAAPMARANCDRLELTVSANRDGDLVCFALGDDLTFGLLVPVLDVETFPLQAERDHAVPNEMVSQHGEIWWPATGEPGVTLVACLLFDEQNPDFMDVLREYSGAILSSEQVGRLAASIQQAQPLDAASAQVTILEARDTLGLR